MEVAKGLGRLFYIISPNETAIEDYKAIPDYAFKQGTPYYLTFIVLEFLILWMKNKPTPRLNDSVVSLSHGLYYGCAKVLVRGAESSFYVQIYNRWRIYDLAWDSPVTWYIAAIGVDFFYYWFHRASHEINFFWTSHQVHHSSEEYNLTTALRQSGIQGYLSWVFYLPLALFVPPSIFLIHQQFNLLYQFWIHTEVVDSIGPLEYVLNTARHHRIHHGSNRYCLDKNYAGVLIIWDRMFGTFEEEKPGEKIVYGLVEDVESFNPFWLQFFYIPKHLSRISEAQTIGDKISVLAKGPGWSPGKPRLGDPLDCPEVPTRKKFHVNIPAWQNVYIFFHFLLIIAGFDYLGRNLLVFSQLTAICSVFYVMYSLTSIGLILENRKLGILTEALRCTLGFWIANSAPLGISLVRHSLLGLYGGSLLLWIGFAIWVYTNGHNEENQKFKTY